MSNQNPLSQQTQSAIQKALSEARLNPYLREANGQIDKAIKIYQLNLQLSAALYPSLNVFEITFRNQIDGVLQSHYKKNWYEGGDILQGIELESIDKVKQNLRCKKKPLTRNRIIAELSLGFWSGLITKKDYKQNVFNQCIKDIFPYAESSERNSKTIAPCFKENILHLRNRVFHHEPIWNNSYKVKEKYEYLCKTLRWMNPNVLDWLQTYDNFYKVHEDAVKELNKLA